MNNNLKQRVLQLIGDFKSDSKSKSKQAEKELIDICEPIIKKFYDISRTFGSTIKNFGFPHDYMSSRGNIDSFVEFNNEKLVFYYTDGCMGNFYEEYLEMPLHWLDEGAEEDYFNYCKEYALREKTKEIEDLKLKNPIILSNLKKQYKKIESMNYSKEN